MGGSVKVGCREREDDESAWRVDAGDCGSWIDLPTF